MIRRATKDDAPDRSDGRPAGADVAPAEAAGRTDRSALAAVHAAPIYAAMYGPTAGLRRGGHG